MDKITTFKKISLALIFLVFWGNTFAQNQNIDVLGNGNSITNNNPGYSTADNTDYGNVSIGVPFALDFEIENTHTGGSKHINKLTIGTITVTGANAGDFVVTTGFTGTIDRANSETITITFTPGAVGFRYATVTIPNDSADGSEQPYVINLRGNGVVQPEMDVLGGAPLVSIVDGTTSTNPLDWTAFGNTAVGVPIDRIFTIDNTAGSATLNITNPVTLSSTGTSMGTYFSVIAAPPATVAAGAIATFTVRFNPTVRGDFLDFITIVNNDSDENPYEFSISGTSFIAGSGDTWYYHDTAGVDLDATLPTWKTDTGLYATWSAGPSQLGFGDGDESTIVANNSQITTYFRKQVTASAIEAGHSTLVLRALRDDGIIVYVNGTKVWQNNMGATTLNYLSRASSDVTGNPENAWLQYKLSNILNTGINEVAVEIHQSTSSITDLSFDFSLYTEDGSLPPDVDGDYVVDYLDSDVDNDGVPDIAEGCYTANLGSLHTTAGTSPESINSTINGNSVTMDDGNTITFTKTGVFNGIQSYFAGEHGWSIRTQGAGTNGTLEFDFGADVNDLFFKLADFDENETYTVDVFDDTNTLINLSTSGNVYQLGAYITQIGNTFNDKFNGNATNNDGDAVAADPFGSVYFYFPNTAVSRILFTILQPDGSSIRITAMHFCDLDTDGDGIDDYHDSDSDNDSIPDTVEAGGYDTDGDGVADDVTDTDGDGLPDVFDSTPAVYFAYELTVLPDFDFDGDGVNSRIDLDSDNDGILDIIEAGDTDSNGDGQIDGFTDSNNDGYHDAYDGAGSMLITGADGNSDGLPDSYPYDNQDATGLPNFMDIDSDDDGITDNTEAQATGAYITYSATQTDTDGIVDVFDNSGTWGGNGLTPIDTDFDCIPDYLDTNSDDDPENDRIEGHDTNGDGVVNGSDVLVSDTGLFVGTDTDNDGLDNGFDNNDAGFDATNSSLQATSHPDADGLYDRDWRASNSPIDFDGTNDFIDCGNVLAISGAFSIEAWVLQEGTKSPNTILSKRDFKTSNKRGYHLIIDGLNRPNLAWFNASGVKILNITSSNPITNNKWHHIAATYNGSTAKLFVDGIKVATGTTTTAPATTNEKFMIGAMYNSDNQCTGASNYFNGRIYEVRVWDTALRGIQIREMMNQRIQNNGGNTRGTIIPIDISDALPWSNLKAYYSMNSGIANDQSGNSNHGFPKNITSNQVQSAPLPYTTKADGDWNDTSGSTPWTFGDSVWNYPNATGINGVKINWNIVQTSDNIDSANEDITLMGLISDTTGKTLTMANPGEPLDELNSGQGLNITHYLKLDGKIDLVGESQLVQKRFYADFDNNPATPKTTLQAVESMLDPTSIGNLERDQQGTADTYTYNYWSSPVGPTSGANNEEYSLPEVLMNGTDSASPSPITFLPTGYDGVVSGSNRSLADYWIWKYANAPAGDYSEWQHIRSTNDIFAGEGFTMKGPGSGVITADQNYVFNGKPNNGDINLSITEGYGYLVGNPYASAIDANQFILDNAAVIAGQGATDGTLYFWEHWGGGSHITTEYQGGYGMYNMAGATPSASNGALHVDLDPSGVANGSKTPGRYIPVGQGFFVTGLVTGTVSFNNDQRIFQRENGNASSTFMRSANNKKGKTTEETSGDPRLQIRLGFNSVGDYRRQILVTQDENATPGIDLLYDAGLWDYIPDDMYWLINTGSYDGWYGIQGTNEINSETILPLGIHAATDGVNTITIDELKNVPENLEIYIHDKELETYHDLRASDYEIYLIADFYTERFEITFGETIIEEPIEEEPLFTEFQVFYSNEKSSIVIHNPDLVNIESIELYTILGQSIIKFGEIINDNLIELKTKQARGIYIIKVKSEGETLAKKVLIK